MLMKNNEDKQKAYDLLTDIQNASEGVLLDHETQTYHKIDHDTARKIITDGVYELCYMMGNGAESSQSPLPEVDEKKTDDIELWMTHMKLFLTHYQTKEQAPELWAAAEEEVAEAGPSFDYDELVEIEVLDCPEVLYHLICDSAPTNDAIRDGRRSLFYCYGEHEREMIALMLRLGVPMARIRHIISK